MSQTVNAARTQFTKLNTDFGYDALGGVGKTRQLGRHEVEVLEAPKYRQSDRVPGPPKTIGRWFNKLLDAITPQSWRAQGKFQRGLEDYAANLNRAMGHLYNTLSVKGSSVDRASSLNLMLKEMATFKDNAREITSRGVEYKDLLSERMQLNMQILKHENKEQFDAFVAFKDSGDLNAVINSLDAATQGDIIDDLKLMQESIPDLKKTQEKGQSRLAYVFKDLKNFIQENFTLKGRVLKELLDNQGLLKDLSSQARSELVACLDSIKEAGANLESLDMEAIGALKSQALDKMATATRFAMDSVCQKALENLDKSEVVGQSGVAYNNISKEQVKKELDAIDFHLSADNAQSSAKGDIGSGTDNPFTVIVRDAKAQIDEISELYAEISDNLNALEHKKAASECASAIKSVISDLEPSEDLEILHNTLIEALQSGYVDARNNFEFNSDYERAIESFKSQLVTADNLDVAAKDNALDKLNTIAPLSSEQMILQDRLNQLSLHQKLNLSHLDDAKGRLNDLAEIKSLHQCLGHVGALFSQSGLGQADMITAKALQVSSAIFALETTNLKGSSKVLEGQIKSMVSNLSTCMAQMTLATMQSVNPDVRSSWSKNDGLNQDTVRECCSYMTRALGSLVSRLDSSHGQSVAKAVISNGNNLVHTAIRAAQACADLKDKEAAEQLAVCVESARYDADGTLLSMLHGKKWSDTAKADVGSHKVAINDFIKASSNLNVTKNQNDLLLFLTDRINRKDIVVHDVYRGFDNGIYMLINTDRQNMLGKSKEVQGTKLVKLPDPAKLEAGRINTGVTRLDEFFNNKAVREDFYPKLYSMLNEHFDGVPFDFSL